MDIIRTSREMQTRAREWICAGAQVGLVPTMGALHAGHLSLVARSLAEMDRTVVSIFVNPTQFAPHEDLDAYPRPLEDDLEKLKSLGVATVFVPNEEEMYPPGSTTLVQPPAVSRTLEGEFRPDHLQGVSTIVLKLLVATRADAAYFGSKDFQQLAVVRRMVKDLLLPVTIVACPIVRELDGLAMSSRNVYLSPSERKTATVLHQTLRFFAEEVAAGEVDGHVLMAEMRQRLIDGGVTSIDYAVVTDPGTLEIQESVSLPTVALLAVQVGKTRLLDNCELHRGPNGIAIPVGQ